LVRPVVRKKPSPQRSLGSQEAEAPQMAQSLKRLKWQPSLA
jgi:hypothetical protein